MNERQARTTANLVMAAAALGAVVAILRSPTLRRLVGGLAKTSAGPLAAYAAATVRDAWEDSRTSPARERAQRTERVGLPEGRSPSVN